MRSADLTEAQAHALAERLRPMLGYLNKLETWMVKEHFPVDDELYVLARKAYHAVHDLSVRVHYLGCRGTGHAK